MSPYVGTIGTCQGCGGHNQIMYGMQDVGNESSIRWMDAKCATSWADAWSKRVVYEKWRPVDKDTQDALEATREWKSQEDRT